LKGSHVGTFFLFMFSSFNSEANCIAFLYKDTNYNDLGVISLFSLYAAFGVNYLFTSNISALFNPKYNLKMYKAARLCSFHHLDIH